MLKHWDELTLFLRQAGAPLDNNVCERALKKAILHRKNALFYKTQNGARVGDLFMSLIYTCQLNQANPFDYLTELQRHAEALADEPRALDAVELPRRAGLSVDESGRAVRVDPPGRRQRHAESRPCRSARPSPGEPVPSRKPSGPTAALRQALARRKKAELVDVLVELAEADRGILRQLTARFDVATTPDELVAATRQAIADATDFDERDINRNFDYDDEAYGEVKTEPGPPDRLGTAAAGHAALRWS